jgi:hypothetical protein
MSLLEVLIVVVAFIVAACLIAGLDKFLGPKLNYPRWIVQLAYVLLAVIVILYVCNQLGVWSLLSRVRA